MVHHVSTLVALLALVDKIPLPPAMPHRGRPRVYSDRLFLKALVIMIIRHLPKVHSLLAALDQPTPEMGRLRTLLSEDGHYPCRRTFERRLNAMPETLPAQIICLGRYLLGQLKPWRDRGPAVAIDSTPLTANGGVWHKKHRLQGIVPHSSIDTEASWTHSGWHGFVYGWKLHLVNAVCDFWLPLVAELTPAHVADNVEAPRLLEAVPPQARYALADVAYNTEELHRCCGAKGLVLIASKRGAYPHTDQGAPVRSIFHRLRSRAMENFNAQFKLIFDYRRPVPTRGRLLTARCVLGAVFVYQLALLCRFRAGADLRVGIKPFLQAA